MTQVAKPLTKAQVIEALNAAFGNSPHESLTEYVEQALDDAAFAIEAETGWLLREGMDDRWALRAQMADCKSADAARAIAVEHFVRVLNAYPPLHSSNEV